MDGGDGDFSWSSSRMEQVNRVEQLAPRKLTSNEGGQEIESPIGEFGHFE